MEKLGRRIFLIAGATISLVPAASALELKYWGEANIPTDTTFKKTKVGGLSAMVWQDDQLWAVSDDKGQWGEPRFYRFSLKFKKGDVQMKPESVHPLKGFKKSEFLDLEGLASLENGNFLISSEGSSDKKPREMPRLFEVTRDGKWLRDWPVPLAFIPEMTGQQKKGVQNNKSFEGLSGVGETVIVATESPLTQDEKVGPYSRLIRYQKVKGEWFADKQWAYQLADLKSNDSGPEVFNGVSEVLLLPSGKILVMERGIRVKKSGWFSTVRLFVADPEKATDISSMGSLEKGKFQPMAKVPVLNFEEDLKGRKKEIENFEALAFGPQIDGKKTLLILSDNNFSSRQTTELLVFTVEKE